MIHLFITTLLINRHADGQMMFKYSKQLVTLQFLPIMPCMAVSEVSFPQSLPRW